MTGHIRRRGERSWELKFDLGTDPSTGRRVTKFASFKGSKRDAEKELTRLKAGADKGEYVDPSATTLSEFLDRWHRDWCVGNVSPKTAERYREIALVHVVPRIGAVRLQKLKPVVFAELYAKLQKPKAEGGAGLAPRTVGHVHRLLHRALGHAVEWDLIASNPASAKPPKVEDTEVEILNAEQVREVLDKLRGRALYPLASLGLATGARRGEMLALRWRDVDLDAGKLRVEQSLEQTKAGLRFKAPKTKHGRRTISLPASTVADLRAHWKAQQEMRLKLGMGKAPDDALVLGNWDGAARSPSATSKEWKRTLAQLKLPPVGLHALRHTHASQLIAAGMDVLTISRRLGHGSPMITLKVYGHAFGSTDDRAALVMEAAFGKAISD